MQSEGNTGIMEPTKKRKLEEDCVDVPSETGIEIDVEDARKILDALTHEELLEILQEATVKHSDVLEQVRAIADKDPSHRKLFIRNLGWETTTESLRAVFSELGELEECAVIIDKRTGKGKGYGFVTFKHIDGALTALKEPSKKIDGRITLTRLASAGGQPIQPPADVSDRKIFVGNVPTDMPSDRLLSLFSEYGEIEEGPLGFDKQSGKSRSFALFIFKTAEAAMRALEEPVKVVDGNKMFCKLAVEGQQQKPLPPPGVNPSVPGALNQQVGGYVNPGYGVNQGSNPAGLHPYQGLSHNGMGVAPYSGSVPVGSMGHNVNQGMTSNTVPSSLGMGGGYGGGMTQYGAPQGGGGYGGSQGASGAYGPMGAGSVYGAPPSTGPSVGGGFPEVGRHPVSTYQQPGAGQVPTSRTPAGGMYPNGAQQFPPRF